MKAAKPARQSSAPVSPSQSAMTGSAASEVAVPRPTPVYATPIAAPRLAAGNDPMPKAMAGV